MGSKKVWCAQVGYEGAQKYGPRELSRIKINGNRTPFAFYLSVTCFPSLIAKPFFRCSGALPLSSLLCENHLDQLKNQFASFRSISDKPIRSIIA